MNKQLLKARIKRTLYVGAVDLMRLSGVSKVRRLAERPYSLRVLMYHKINRIPHNPITVAPEAFARQQEYLRKNYCVISLADLLDSVEGGRLLPSRAVLLTFDDGYLDNLEAAHGILKAAGHRALLFIPTGFVGDTRPFHHDSHLPFANPTLDWDQIRGMQDVFDIGSHGVSHRIMTKIPREEAKQEIRDSKTILERELGHEVAAFSYPNGSIADYDDDLEKTVIDAGYRVCFTTIPRTNMAGFDRFQVSRYNVEDYGMTYFAGLLDGSSDLLGLKDTHFGYEVKRFVNRLAGGPSK